MGKPDKLDSGIDVQSGDDDVLACGLVKGDAKIVDTGDGIKRPRESSCHRQV